ncbi:MULTISPECIES: DUF2461 domain-containing protein [unclassified Undibacterium]|uniref:DUF2461 domain-containing protein n=1 Tax=unclassified Undibacterium TaxID=2630295 RepID=UPI002AC8A3A1|nr:MULTISPECIES: DUF2461 domain-containing protein [unclassified Undibacterium]MEB0139736.1 DUF2461 domain-containing protein [Undibacterium sp. CCC2.1]MEB0172617.1 DUF2461 domain-containing protein [Undibacterium sp. CCC1.1]MEB0176402.1 DUF2461 domain-containing protein [Undibacterium sp. CCC3.4]MEB0215740.1 DUF2461 domain-containing protein [Undibacterium sp. 5I2]WPX45163.1 DUF2461 domain-containing protein [Undibacterium sp. CCC3.4]
MHLIDLQAFLSELADNNQRAWFVMNKPRYDILRAEFLEMVGELIHEIQQFDPVIIGCEPKKAMFRINRDVRFGHDKSPYKTTFSSSILPFGRKKPSEGGGPAYYFQLDAHGRLFFACGEYMPPADRLKAIREHILADQSGFEKLLKDKKLRQVFGELQQEGKLKRPPKGFAADAKHIEYLKLKNFMVWTECPYQGQSSAAVQQTLLQAFHSALPLVKWLRAA